MKRRRKILVFAFLIGAIALHQYLRPRAFPAATVVVSTPAQDVAATHGIAPQIHPIDKNLNLTITPKRMTFGDREHEVQLAYTYLGGMGNTDCYSFDVQFDGSRLSKTCAFTGDPVTVFERGGYRLTLLPEEIVD